MKILAIMVAYNRGIPQSDTYKSFMCALAKNNCENIFSFLVYDNSPSSQNLDCSVPVSTSYLHDPTNAGLAKAYNYALDEALSNGCDWLLLLDQDSILPEDFTVNLIKTAKTINADENLVAIVPRVNCMGKIVSPSIVKFGGRFRPVDVSIRGISYGQITSINSGTMLRTKFMKTIGGFNTSFSLDYLDHWLFSTIHSNNKLVFISESVVEHELSIMDYEKWMNLERYENILAAETLFLKTCRPKNEKYFYILRLMKRMAVQLLGQNKAIFCKSTLRTLKSVVFGVQDQGSLH